MSLVIRSFDEFSALDNNKLEEMWSIVLFEEPEESADEIEKTTFAGLLDMLYDEWASKENTLNIQNQPSKAFASADVLDILQTIFTDCFMKSPNFEVAISDIEKG